MARKPKSRRRGLVLLLALVLAAGAAGAGFVVTRGWPGAAEAATDAGAPTATGGAEPTSVDDGGEGAAEGSDGAVPSADPSDGQVVATDEPVEETGSAATVVVTYHGWNPGAGKVQVGGYVAGRVENGGTCTLTLTRGGTTVTGQVDARPDAAATACGEVAIPGSRLSAGTWQAVLSYASDTASGAAPAVTVEVTP